MNQIKNTIKIANKIQQALFELKKYRFLELLNRTATFVSQFKELGCESKKLGLSLTHNWLSASQRCCSRISKLLYDIAYSVSRLQQLTDSPKKELPKLSTLVEELNQLQEEFEKVEFNINENTVSIVTRPITLEDVYLGPFKIELHIDKLKDLYKDGVYYAIALDPHPAATSEDVTHPHVSNERLCEGDGAAAIRTALQEGRICDFFSLVNSILNTYNPDSPYVNLDDWNGEPCYDCGYTCDRENIYYCPFCDNSYCEQCSSYCRLCDEILCLGCGGKCPHCQQLVCPNCISRCTECGQLCCKECLDKGLCPDCIEESEDYENEKKENQNITRIKLPNQTTIEAGKPEIKQGT